MPVQTSLFFRLPARKIVYVFRSQEEGMKHLLPDGHY
jgi:hypothetical protein